MDTKRLNERFIKACKKRDKKLIKKYARKLIEQGYNEDVLRAYYDFTFCNPF